MGIRRWTAGKIATIGHRIPEPSPAPGSGPAAGEAVVTDVALAANRDAAQCADAQREAWFQYLDGQEPANDARPDGSRHSARATAERRPRSAKSARHGSRHSAKPTAKP